MLATKAPDALNEPRKFLIVDLAILEGADVKGALGGPEDAIPVFETLVEAHHILAELLCALRVGRDQNRDIFEFFAVATDVIEEFDDVGIVFAGLVGEIPTFEALVVAVALDGFFEKGEIEFDLFPPVSSPPMKARVIGSKVDIEVVLVGQRVEGLAKIIIDGQQVRDGLGGEDALVLVARPDDDDGIDPDLGIELKLLLPVRIAPVLAGNIVGDLIEKCAGYSGQGRHSARSLHAQRACNDGEHIEYQRG